MLSSPTVERQELIEGTGWLFTSHELIIFLDGGQTTETELELGANRIATTNGVLNWITSLNRSEVVA